MPLDWEQTTRQFRRRIRCAYSRSKFSGLGRLKSTGVRDSAREAVDRPTTSRFALCVLWLASAAGGAFLGAIATNLWVTGLPQPWVPIVTRRTLHTLVEPLTTLVAALVGALVGGLLSWATTRASARHSRITAAHAAALVMMEEFERIQPLAERICDRVFLDNSVDQFARALDQFSTAWREERHALAAERSLDALVKTGTALSRLEALRRARTNRGLAMPPMSMPGVVDACRDARNALGAVAVYGEWMRHPWFQRAWTRTKGVVSRTLHRTPAANVDSPQAAPDSD